MMSEVDDENMYKLSSFIQIYVGYTGYRPFFTASGRRGGCKKVFVKFPNNGSSNTMQKLQNTYSLSAIFIQRAYLHPNIIQSMSDSHNIFIQPRRYYVRSSKPFPNRPIDFNANLSETK